MSEVGERKRCGVSDRFFREYGGTKFWFWPKRGFYVSQRGGKQVMLHRVWLGASKSDEAVPIDGNWDNFDRDNWNVRGRNVGRNVASKHPFQTLNGVKYYVSPETGYYSRRYPRSEFMHRAVWIDAHGEIPDGYHIHHKNHDKSDNRPANLQCMSASDHSMLHAETNPWVGSDENKRQLRAAGKLARGGRKMRVGCCEVCNAEFETIALNRRFCGKSCRYKSEWQREASLRSDC